MRHLVPWLDRSGWRDVAGLVAVALTLRIVLYMVDPKPLFTTDSGTYLRGSRTLFLPYDRPVGTGLFYRLVLRIVDDLRTLVAAQALLGVFTTVLSYALGRESGLGRRTAIGAAVVVSVAPSTLLFEKTMHAEALAVFLVALTLLALVVALRSEPRWPWVGVGVLTMGAFFVRTATFSLLLTALLAVFLWWPKGGLKRLTAAVVLAATAAVPAAVYGSAMAYQTLRLLDEAHFGITFFDGVSIFALVAEHTNCENPKRLPPMRAVLCADPAFLDGDPGRILWGEGPVQAAIRIREWPPVNAELRRLALEAILRDPVDFARESLGRVTGLFGAYDPGHFLTYAANPADAGLGEVVSVTFASDIVYPPPGYISFYSRALSVWYRLRWLAMAGLLGAAALSLVPGAGHPVRVLILFALVSVTLIVTTTYTSPRLLYPVELPAVVSSAWLVEQLRSRVVSGSWR
jgi:hypothetical protein